MTLRGDILTLDNALHAAGGFALQIVFTIAGTALPGLCFVATFAITRELWQHRDDRPLMNAHRWAEAAAWPVGALPVAVWGWVG